MRAAERLLLLRDFSCRTGIHILYVHVQCHSEHYWQQFLADELFFLKQAICCSCLISGSDNGSTANTPSKAYYGALLYALLCGRTTHPQQLIRLHLIPSSGP